MNPKTIIAAALPFGLAILAAGCSAPAERDTDQPVEGGAHAEEGAIVLSPDQIAAAGIATSPVLSGGSGSIELPATVEGDPQAMQVVSAAIGGRVVALNRNLGQSVARGEVMAIIESREAAQIKGEVEAARARLALA